MNSTIDATGCPNDFDNTFQETTFFQCDDSSRMTMLILGHANLTGPLEWICVFLDTTASLTSVTLFYNHLYGSIPTCIALTTILQQIRLEGNSLGGAFPDMTSSSLGTDYIMNSGSANCIFVSYQANTSGDHNCFTGCSSVGGELPIPQICFADLFPGPDFYPLNECNKINNATTPSCPPVPPSPPTPPHPNWGLDPLAAPTEFPVRPPTVPTTATPQPTAAPNSQSGPNGPPPGPAAFPTVGPSTPSSGNPHSPAQPTTFSPVTPPVPISVKGTGDGASLVASVSILVLVMIFALVF